MKVMLVTHFILYFVILAYFTSAVNADKQKIQNQISDSVLTIKSLLKGIGEGFN